MSSNQGSLEVRSAWYLLVKKKKKHENPQNIFIYYSSLTTSKQGYPQKMRFLKYDDFKVKCNL